LLPVVEAPWALLAVCLGSLALVHAAFRSLGRRQHLHGIPTSAAAAVHLGLNRVHGRARPTVGPLVAPISGSPCVAWSWSVEDEWRRDSLVRWRRRRRWRTVASQSDATDFDLVDGSGSIRIRIDGALIVGRRSERRLTDRSDPDLPPLAAPDHRGDATGRRRVTELIVPLEYDTTVIGTAELPSGARVPEMGWHPEDRTLLVSSVGATVHAGRSIVLANGLLLAAGAVLALAPLAIRGSEPEYGDALRASGRWGPTLLVAAAAVVAGYWLQHVHRSLVGLRQRVARAWSLVSVEVERRHALLPGLVHAAAAAAHHQEEVLALVAGARPLRPTSTPVETDPASVARADSDDGRVAGVIMAIGEHRPELRADETFERVREAMVEAENRMALARSFYNDSVTIYNDHRQGLPVAAVAGLLGFDRVEQYRT
jgi:LemA protein